MSGALGPKCICKKALAADLKDAALLGLVQGYYGVQDNSCFPAWR
jgi:hypothetical protein